VEKNIFIAHYPILVVAGLKSREYKERCSELGLETMKERRHKQDLALVHKLMQDGPDASILQRTRENNEGARTRQVTANGLATQYARTDLRKYSFAVRVADKRNRLPESVRTATSKETFKRELKKARN
jgi:hypothetical protein